MRLAVVANNDEENLGIKFDSVFKDKMAEHIDTIAGVDARDGAQCCSGRPPRSRG